MKAKLDVDFRRYVILGACNPQLAHKALSVDLGVGLLLPCNVCVWEDEGGSTVSAIIPQAMFSIVNNPSVQPIADEVAERLQRGYGDADRGSDPVTSLPALTGGLTPVTRRPSVSRSGEPLSPTWCAAP